MGTAFLGAAKAGGVPATGRKREESAALIGIYEISKVLGATLDMGKALHDVLNILSSYMEMRQGAIVLTDGDGGLYLAAVTGMSLRLAREGQLKYPFAAARQVMDNAVPMVAHDGDEPMLADYLAETEGVDDDGGTFFCVPVKTTEKPFGALSVRRTGIHSNVEHDLRLLAMVATLVGQTVSLHRQVAADRGRLMDDNARLSKQMAEIRPAPVVRGLEDVIGVSDAMRRVFAQVQRAAPTKATVLVRGESGTGKERIAHAIHVLSPRASKPFVSVNCAALSESVLESELFGHDKGAFTGAVAERKGRFELAHGGTLFLDEIGDISPNFQAKLLRVLQEGEFERVGGSKTIKTDVRLVAATNRDLEQAVSKGEFRADLYFRLNVVPIFLPPLRERLADIPALAQHFLDKFNAENGQTLRLSQRVVEAFRGCHFPGNVRELENCIYRTATMAKGTIIDFHDLACRHDVCLSATLWPKRDERKVAAPSAPTAAPPPPLAAEDGEMPERERLIQAMEHCGWVQAKAARLLGLTPRQIGYALRKHDIEIRQL